MSRKSPREPDVMAALPLATTISQRIKDFILTKQLHPGDLLPSEAELGVILGVSRSSIREAVRRLAALDIIDVRHGTGTFVGQLSLSPLVEGLVFRGVLAPGDDLAALREVVELRVTLDTMMAERLVDALHGAENPDLHALVAEMEAKSRAGQPFLEADRAFHSHLTERLGNQLLQQLVTSFWEVHTAVSPELGLPQPQQLDSTAKAHGAMLRAGESGDVEGFRKAIKAHYAPLWQSLDQHGRAQG